MLKSKYFSGMMRIILYPQTDRWVSSDTNSSIIVLRNKGYPSFMSSWSSTCQVVAILDLWSKRGTGKYKEKVYDLPEHLEEKVSSSPRQPRQAYEDDQRRDHRTG
ncbi:hypothetical protein K1719_047619 [Acacia pycnantha]|nr:hypothetical protein K1719_047619 [Acacia pycnantha]